MLLFLVFVVIAMFKCPLKNEHSKKGSKHETMPAFNSGVDKIQTGNGNTLNRNDFLLGSAAIVECLWSKFDALVLQRRRGMSPIMVEGILYLKENRDLWGIEDVKEALRRVKENEKKERTKKKMQAHQDEELQIAAEALSLGTQGGVSGVVDYSE